MEVNLEKKETKSGWFDIKGGGRVNIRLLSAADVEAMKKACLTVVDKYPLLLNPETGKEEYRFFQSQEFNEGLFEEMKNDLSIVGWDTMVNAKTKEPIEVTKENKNLLMFPGVCPQFVEAVEAGRKALKEQDRTEREESEKNLSPGPSGTSPNENSTVTSAA
jgi:hypothetical protein